MSGPGQQGNCKNSIAERVTTGNYSVSKNVLWAVDFVMSLQRWVPIVSLWFPRYIINIVYCDGGLQRMLICLFVCFCILSHSISIVLKTTSSLLFLMKVWQDTYLLNILFRCWRHRGRGGICTKFFCVCHLPLPARRVWKGGVDDLLRDW